MSQPAPKKQLRRWVRPRILRLRLRRLSNRPNERLLLVRLPRTARPFAACQPLTAFGATRVKNSGSLGSGSRSKIWRNTTKRQATRAKGPRRAALGTPSSRKPSTSFDITPGPLRAVMGGELFTRRPCRLVYCEYRIHLPQACAGDKMTIGRNGHARVRRLAPATHRAISLSVTPILMTHHGNTPSSSDPPTGFLL